MSVKKKSAPKPTQPKAKYRIGTKLFFIHYLGSRKVILEGEVESIQSAEYPEKDNLGKMRGSTTLFDYALSTKHGEMEVNELLVFPNYTEVAKEFAMSFLVQFK